MDTRTVMRELDACASQVDSCYLRIAKAYGLTYNELMLLYVVDESGEVTQRAAADALFLTRSSVHTVLGSLMGKGLLALVDGRNLKERNIVLTPAGRQRMSEIGHVTERIEEAALRTVSPSDRDLVLRVAGEVARLMADATEQELGGGLR